MLLTAVLWSSSGLLVKVSAWPPLAILSGRSLVAALVFLLYLRRVEFHLTRWQVIGALGYVGMQLFFIMATKLTTAANAIFLQYTAPVFVALFGWLLLNERPRRADWLAMTVIFVGMVLFFGDRLSFDGMLGNVLAIISGVAMAATTVAMRAQRRGTPANTILLGNMLGFVIGLPVLLQQTFTPQDVGIILYLGVFQIGISFVLYSVAIKHVAALEAVLILTLEPILNPLWVFLVLGETPGRYALLGGLLVLGAVVVRAVNGSRATAAPGVSVGQS